MKNLKYLLPMAIISAVLAAALAKHLGGSSECFSDTALMLDTLVEVSVWGSGTFPAEAAAESAMAVIAGVDSVYGDGLVDARAEADLVGSEAFRGLLEVSRRVHTLTGGLFDPTIGSVSRFWRFWEEGRLPDPDSIKAGLASVSLERYLAGDRTHGVIFDVGGIAKGRAVELAVQKLRDLGFRSAIVSAGGDLRLLGRRPDGKPWRVAIRHPRKEGAFVGYLDLEEAAVSTSGDYERCFFVDGERYHHVLDPRTGMPGRASESVTVVASDATLSDAMATGLFLMGPKRGLALLESEPGIEAVFVYAEGESVAVSKGLDGRFTRLEAE